MTRPEDSEVQPLLPPAPWIAQTTPQAKATYIHENGNGTAEVNDEAETENPDRPQGIRFAIVYTCILMGYFFVGYDTSCVATLTSVISEEYSAIDDVGWYGIAFILALASSILTFGQLYTIYPMKTIFLVSFTILGIGSVICASAQTSTVFIIGRAFSGLGSAGLFSGGSIILANTTPLKHRPIYQGIAGGIECTALALGPVVSGAIAGASSWRTCFYIIIPVAASNILAVWLFVVNLPEPENAHFTTKQRFAQLDLLGACVFVPLTVCFVLAMQWGGTVYPWDAARIVVLVALAAVLAPVFVYSQWRAGSKAMFPLGLLKQRSVSLGAMTMFFMCASMYVFDFYLPIYFQAIRGASTLESGLAYLPLTISLAVAIFTAGSITSYIGYFTPVMLAGVALCIVASVLLTTLTVDTPAYIYLLYQIPLGVGAGLAWQQPYTAVQAILPQKDVATGIVVLSFTQQLGGIAALAVSQNVFLNLLVEKLTALEVPGLDVGRILDGGPLGLADAVGEGDREVVYGAYMEAIVGVYWVGVLCALFTVASIGIEWRSVKEEKKVEEEHGGESE